jgi:ribose 5-phosphate isomerase B
MKIALGSDHAGFELKQLLSTYLEQKHIEIVDFGTNSSESMDYPDVAHPLSSSVESNEVDMGILICGSANGVAMAANKHSDIRAAICWEKEIASLARLHNNANVLCLPARFIDSKLAMEICDVFITTDFEGGRHQRRVEKITCS